MLRTLFYRIIYYPPINKVLRSIAKLIIKIFGVGYMLPVSGTIRLKLDSGRSFYLHTNQTDFVSKWVYYKGLYNYEYVRIFESLVTRCDGVIDVGCNAGLYSILTAVSSDNQLKVLSFDPSTASNHFMRTNIELNNVQDKVSYFNIALSNSNGEHTFYEVRNPKYPFELYNLGGASSLVNKPDQFDRNEVKVFRLDDFIQDNNFEDIKFDLIKIDAEGAEPRIIEGMGLLLQRCKPILICEILLGSDGDELSNVISGYDYRVLFFKDGKLEEADDLSAFSGDLVRNCFFVPEDKLNWFSAFI